MLLRNTGEQTKARVRQLMAEMGCVHDRGPANPADHASMTVGLITLTTRGQPTSPSTAIDGKRITHELLQTWSQLGW